MSRLRFCGSPFKQLRQPDNRGFTCSRNSSEAQRASCLTSWCCLARVTGVLSSDGKTVMTISNMDVYPSALTDSDPSETQEWLEAFDALLQSGGPQRCKELLHKLQQHALYRNVRDPILLNTPYCNTVRWGGIQRRTGHRCQRSFQGIRGVIVGNGMRREREHAAYATQEGELHD